MKLVIFGLTVSSSWGNGHATLWRALIRALARRGWEVVFYERDVPYYARARDLIQLGAYQPGADPELDAAVKMSPKLTALLQQDMHERASMAESRHQLGKAITL